MSCSICIPTYRRPDSLAMCLASIASFLPDYRIDEVLVGVTGARDDSIGYGAESMLQVMRTFGTEVNVVDGLEGLLDAKEMFASDAKSDILLLLDDDAVIPSNYLSLMQHLMGSWNKNVAAVSGSLQTPLDVDHYKDWSAEPIAAPSSRTVCNKVRMDGDLVVIDDKYQVYMLDKPIVYRCEVLVGTALFIRKRLLQVDREYAKGGYYYEEYDFTYGLFKSGWELRYDSARVAWHVRAPQGGCRAVDDRSKERNGRYFKEKFGL